MHEIDRTTQSFMRERRLKRNTPFHIQGQDGIFHFTSIVPKHYHLYKRGVGYYDILLPPVICGLFEIEVI